MPDVALATRTTTYLQAVNEALRWALAEYPEALFFGEDIALPGGVFGASKGLQKEFGERVFDMPISEAAILGGAVGAAMRGRRPIVEIMFADFFFVALDQLFNQAANVRYTSRGGYTCPITVRSQQAAMPGACAQHTQSVEGFFAHCPGLRVGLPSNPQDAYEMLRAAVASDDPVIVLESRALYQTEAEVSLSGEVEKIGGARVVRQGGDVTIVTWSRMVQEAESAATTLSDRGIHTEVIDLRWLSPLDFDTVLRSVEKTSRLVIVHEANRSGGFGAEVAAQVSELGLWFLEAPIERVAAPDVRIPAAPVLQRAVIPSAKTIVAAVDRSLSR
jgi:pyruvate dehydrogenase E1 component beta subunit/2-oxoisovalerate dehydrogenase E1 component